MYLCFKLTDPLILLFLVYIVTLNILDIIYVKQRELRDLSIWYNRIEGWYFVVWSREKVNTLMY